MDGISFRKIATVAAAGNSSTIMKYQYIDKGLSENNYYRLKSVDQDGKAAFSKTVLIKDITIAQGVVIEGNPFVSNISLRLFKKAAAAGVLKLLDPTGRVVGSQQTAQGAQQLVFVLPTTLARGTYYLRAEIDGRTYTSTIMKK